LHSVGRKFGWLVSWLVECLYVWFFWFLVFDCLVVWLFGCLVVLIIFGSVVGLFDWSVGWLVGWLVLLDCLDGLSVD
jgi:hypothetical protein